MDDQPIPRLDPRLARRLAEKKATLDRYRPLAPQIVRRLHDDLRVLLTYHSNAIEGNTLSLRETQLVLEHGVTVGGHTLREYLEATNHAEAFSYLITLADAHADHGRNYFGAAPADIGDDPGRRWALPPHGSLDPWRTAHAADCRAGAGTDRRVGGVGSGSGRAV